MKITPAPIEAKEPAIENDMMKFFLTATMQVIKDVSIINPTVIWVQKASVHK